MRRNRRTGNGIVIDLTSLLDVIFIILLTVMVGQTSETINSEQISENAKHKQEEMDNTISQYNNIMQTEQDIGKWVWIVSISVPYEGDDVHKRHIFVMSEDQQILSYDLNGSSTDDVYEEFRAALAAQIEANSDSPVILALNPDKREILYRDEKRITDILIELSEEYKNVSIKGNLGDT